MVIKDQFMDKFSHHSWVILHHGRAAVLRLDGPHGSLDLTVVYFQTGTHEDISDPAVAPAGPSEAVPLPTQRASLRTRISRSVRPSHEATSIIAGDFNWVAEERDRVCKTSGAYTGNRDRAEEAHWTRLLPAFSEVHQPHMTHSSANSRSRLDRFYCSLEATDLLDRQIVIGVDDWDFRVSNHRPVFFARRAPPPKLAGEKPISAETTRRPGWSHSVALRFHDLCCEPDSEEPVRRLALLRQAIRDVSSSPGSPGSSPLASDNEDKLGCTMAFIRAVESGSTVAISKSIERYPFLCTLVVNPYDPSLAAGRGLASARSHAVELAREHAVSELTRLHESQATMSEAEARSTRLRNTRLLSRLSPGKGKGKFIQATRDAH